MNLRNYPGSFNIGLDLGPASAGWSVVDSEGKLFHFKKKPTWGSRLFDSAQTASEARMHRGQRRRYVRRRWRLNLLQALFTEEMEKVDPGFFMRLNHSRTVEGDPVFTKDFTKKDYYKRFPTIYHLRAHLMETDDPADLRLVYLAIHNIVKHRGNFLRQEEKLTAKIANTSEALGKLSVSLKEWCDSRGYSVGKVDEEAIAAVLADERISRSQKAKNVTLLISVDTGDSKANAKLAKALANAIVGLQAEFKDLFGDFECEATKLNLSEEEKLEALQAACPDDSAELLEAVCGAYSAYVLQGLLSYAEGQTISHNMIKKYDCYAEDLECLKALVRDYLPKTKGDDGLKPFDRFFRGVTYHDLDKSDPSRDYDASKAKGYTAYNLHKLSYDEFRKEVEKLLKGTGAQDDERYITMMDAFEKQRFLRRLKTSDNGAIYYQLHLEELQAILENQGRFYPFLKQEANKIESLVTFRIPYYVGPLTSKNAAKDAHNKNRFQWSERKPGMEDAIITPWNWESVIDKNRSAENFIMRMTGDCTYLAGEKVLPRHSLLYEEFCVLNELNGVRFTNDGDNWHRLDSEQRAGIIRDLFHKKRSVKYADIAAWLVRMGYLERTPQVRGGQGESGLESKMSSYLLFAKDVFGVDELDEALFPAIEQIILWNTLFEDRSIFEEKLRDEFGPNGNGMLNNEQIKKCKKRLSGWGRLSEKFLTGIRVVTQGGRQMSIMNVLREGSPNPDRRQGEALVMMEVLHDNTLGFQKKIDEVNRAYYAQNAKAMGVNELPGSPGIRRSINQAIRIVDEIVKIAGHAPDNIFIEVTRDEDEKKKGKRTVKRWDRIEAALNAFKAEGGDLAVMSDFKRLKNTEADLDERLTLYLLQNGKCLYSGRAIDLDALMTGSGEYEVDHIIPRAYIKDDSLDNKALVYRSENQRKTDQLLIDENVRQKMGETWKQLHDAKMISDKKYNNLMRLTVTEGAMKGFIARQLVETSQIVKMTKALLEARYGDAGTRIVPVKASMSHNLREVAGLVKCREANDFHHAHDAYLACRMGLFIQKRYPGIYENPIGYAHAMKKYVLEQSELFKKTHRMPGSAGLIVNSFMTAGFDPETGEMFEDAWAGNDEIKHCKKKHYDDAWNAAAEVEGIRRALNYRQCYVSRMPYEDSGKFWDANPISKRSNPKLALKNTLDPACFGGYNTKTAAYFFIYEVTDKKGKTGLRIAQMPIFMKAKCESDNAAFEKYCQDLESESRVSFTRIVIPRLLKWQLVEIDGSLLRINAEEEMKSASQLAFSQEELERILLVCTDGYLDADVNRSVYMAIAKALDRAKCPMLTNDLDLISRFDAFCGLAVADQKDLLKKILLLCRGNKQSSPINLSSVGGKKKAGYLRPARSKVPDGMVLIDQSVTGMFERRTRVGV